MKILDCPCGEKPELKMKEGKWVQIVTGSREDPYEYTRTKDWFWFVCPKCKLNTRDFISNSIKKAIKAWNKVSKKERKSSDKHAKDLMYYSKVRSNS